MNYQTLDQLRQRCAAELVGFEPVRDDQLLRTWVWDALRKIDSDRIGEIKDTFVEVIGGSGILPNDFLGLVGMTSEMPGYDIRPGQRQIRGCHDGSVHLHYYALPLDEQGYPLILDIAEEAVLAWVKYKHMALMQQKMTFGQGSNFRADRSYRIDRGLDAQNKAEAESLLASARGEVNMLSLSEANRLRQFRSNVMTYRNYP
ncbi:hypothetical protein CLV58_12557 [Spirosoma oryzae]|uniref:Uncharacterized protein n=1 Tax=Spirosoma oryzae TaxID=1469603 RepID=A0A2T0S8N8_9BACT|nr:hypothetical protein [Spirosoma oryzae]PRY29795.1 hypothetical protein CLV58_12557 [Spirosoma oryzae]